VVLGVVRHESFALYFHAVCDVRVPFKVFKGILVAPTTKFGPEPGDESEDCGSQADVEQAVVCAGNLHHMDEAVVVNPCAVVETRSVCFVGQGTSAGRSCFVGQ
jgi:hypothetical protein